MVTGKPELAADQLKIWIRFSVLYQTTMKHKPNAGMWQGPFWPQRVRSSSTGLACWALADQLWKVRSRSSGRVVSRAERDPMFNRRRRFRTVSEDGVSVAIRAVLPAGSPGGIVRFLLAIFRQGIDHDACEIERAIAGEPIESEVSTLFAEPHPSQLKASLVNVIQVKDDIRDGELHGRAPSKGFSDAAHSVNSERSAGSS